MLYKVSEAASILKVHPVTLRRWLLEGKIKGVKVGSVWRVTQAEIDRIQRGD